MARDVVFCTSFSAILLLVAMVVLILQLNPACGFSLYKSSPFAPYILGRGGGYFKSNNLLNMMVAQDHSTYKTPSPNKARISNKITLTYNDSATMFDSNNFQSLMIDQPVVVGIAGGSASGKTTLAKAIIKEVGDQFISFIGHDNYYKDLQHLTIEERAKVNFDHPDSLDTALLIEHIKALKAGKDIQVPIYDFTTHSRTKETTTMHPRKIILVDGILIFSESDLVDLMDMKIFVDTEDDIRLIRRIQRDSRERGRSVESVIHQYVNTVRPMHQIYVEPSKRKADIIVPAGQGIQNVALDMCVSRLREIINFYQ